MINSRTYRPDIDGLRAIAVVAVMLYHVRTGFAHGGFVGVDVFFVISGFLITGIVFDDIRNGRFSIASFYERRIRRIFPALFAMLLVATICALLLLLPVELLRFAGSLIATTLFAANIYFAAHASYFDPAAIATPLLHTWSLAVEEQFYLIFPLALAFTYKRFPKYLTATVALVAVLSFALSIHGVVADPQHTFFSSPARAWELMLGALLALGVAPTVKNSLALEVAGALGLLSILFATVAFRDSTPFPGAAALIPTLGAALIIWSGGGIRKTRTATVLSWKPVVFVGLISYSLYLWHWPLIVFSRLALNHDLTKLEKVSVLAVSFVLAALSWHFIEVPWRRKKIARSRIRLAGSATAAMATGTLVGLTITMTAGMPHRFSPDEIRLASYAAFDSSSAYRAGRCFLTPLAPTPLTSSCITLSSGAPNVLLLGDSHAADVWLGLTRVFPTVRFLQATVASCRPVLGADPSEPCHHLMQAMLTDFIPTKHLSAVILSADWQPEDLQPLLRTITYLRRNRVRILVFGDVPEYQIAVPRLLAMSVHAHNTLLLRRALLPAPESTDNEFLAALHGTGAEYVSLYRVMCADQSCAALDPDGIPLQFDTDHFTDAGSEWVISRLKNSSGLDFKSRRRQSRPYQTSSRNSLCRYCAIAPSTSVRMASR